MQTMGDCDTADVTEGWLAISVVCLEDIRSMNALCRNLIDGRDFGSGGRRKVPLCSEEDYPTFIGTTTGK